MSPRVALTEDYLYDQPFPTARLKDVLVAHTGQPPAHRKQSTLINKIVELQVSVDWVYVFSDDSDDPSAERAVDNLFRTYAKAEDPHKIIKPHTVTLTPAPLGAKILGDTTDEDMDVDTDLEPVFSTLLRNGPDLYAALTHCPSIDNDWTIQVLVKDCTKEPANPLTSFAVGVEVELKAYDPEKTNTSFYAEAAEVIHGLEHTRFCPAAPWDALWALPGYPWLVGPVARRHTDEAEIQFNSSEGIFREIPVTGSENALRLMVVFKHPTDTVREIPTLLHPAFDSEYNDQIKAYEGPGATKKEPLKEEELETKPLAFSKQSKAKAKISIEAQAKAV
ncbi:hypothetical protein C8F04DRAFT_1257075 [Mycena alexandri]|uniref:Uncharacterized protein n=1 Tax=Mycena alexandri TaxID=1745969 RepID=A0AAD6T197_9AGAR|nr:hypothetical protein C8F04DRAFT_1257075 [Mycena alexandri]